MKGCVNMNYFSVRELTQTPKYIWENIEKKGQAVITNNGRPQALIVSINEDYIEKISDVIRKEKAKLAFRDMQRISEENGNSEMTLDEINEEIRLIKEDMKKKENKCS